MRRAAVLILVCLLVSPTPSEAARRADAILMVLCGLMDPLCRLHGTNLRDQHIVFTNLCANGDVSTLRNRRGDPPLFPDPTKYCATVGKTASSSRDPGDQQVSRYIILGVTWRKKGSLLSVGDCTWRIASVDGFYYLSELRDLPLVWLVPVADLIPRGPSITERQAQERLTNLYLREAHLMAKPPDACASPLPSPDAAEDVRQ